MTFSNQVLGYTGQNEVRLKVTDKIDANGSGDTELCTCEDNEIAWVDAATANLDTFIECSDITVP